MAALETLPDLLETRPEIRGAWMVHESHNRVDVPSHYRPDYVLCGTWVLQLDTGMSAVRLRACGTDTATFVGEFERPADARAEFERLREELAQREIVRTTHAILTGAAVLPVEFEGALRAGLWDALLVAADAQQEAGDDDRAWLLRAAWANATGRANELRRVGRSESVVLCPYHVTPKRKFKAGAGRIGFAAVRPGEVRLVTVRWDRKPELRGIDSRTFKIGTMAEYGSYNLVYFGPVLGVTPKTVTVEEGGPGGRTRRMPMGEFCDRNHDFDLAAAVRRNSEWMD